MAEREENNNKGEKHAEENHGQYNLHDSLGLFRLLMWLYV
jgi:hypothetical protein